MRFLEGYGYKTLEVGAFQAKSYVENAVATSGVRYGTQLVNIYEEFKGVGDKDVPNVQNSKPLIIHITTALHYVKL